MAGRSRPVSCLYVGVGVGIGIDSDFDFDRRRKEEGGFVLVPTLLRGNALWDAPASPLAPFRTGLIFPSGMVPWSGDSFRGSRLTGKDAGASGGYVPTRERGNENKMVSFMYAPFP